MISKRVALAIASVSKSAGQSYKYKSVDKNGNKRDFQSENTRVENMLRVGPYGAYIVDGDPQGWGEGEALATIYMEPKGGDNDCIMPLDYYETRSFDVASRASEILGNCYIEFINPAVACVFRD